MEQVNESWILGDLDNRKGGLLISGLKYFDNPQKINKNNILGVISAIGSSYTHKLDKTDSSISHRIVKIEDDGCQDLKQHFNSCCSFIDQNRIKGNVLVHCGLGVSRSVTIVAAYLIKYKKWKSEEALKFIKERRPIADPNEGFVEQLKLYQLSLNISG